MEAMVATAVRMPRASRRNSQRKTTTVEAAKPKKVKNDTPKKGRKTSKKAIVDEEEEYEVEAIQSHRVLPNHVVEYEVSWVGYEGERTWLEEDNFSNARKILDEYKRKMTGYGGPKSGEAHKANKIVAHRKIDGVTYYMISWLGYNHPLHNSEVTEEDLSMCETMLQQYKERHGLENKTEPKKGARGRKRANSSTIGANTTPPSIKKSKSLEVKTVPVEVSVEVQDDSEDNKEEEVELDQPTTSSTANNVPIATNDVQPKVEEVGEEKGILGRLMKFF